MTRLSATFVLAILLVSCGETNPPPVLQIRGTVRQDGAPLPGVRVFLWDRRSELESGVMIGTATTNGAGQYELQGRGQRTGYVPGCAAMYLWVEGFEYLTNQSAPLRCVSELQTIDLTVTSFPW